MKRIISLVLAISLILSLFTVNASAALPPGRYGDVDQSSAHAITIADATAIQRYLAGYTDLDYDRWFAADYDHDGEVTIDDATWIQRCVAEMDIPEGYGGGYTRYVSIGAFYASYNSGEAAPGTPVTFTALSYDNSVTFEFMIDGAVIQPRSAKPDMTCTFDSAGEHTVRLLAYNSDNYRREITMPYVVAETESTVFRIVSHHSENANYYDTLLTARAQYGTEPYTYSFKLQRYHYRKAGESPQMYDMPRGLTDTDIEAVQRFKSLGGGAEWELMYDERNEAYLYRDFTADSSVVIFRQMLPLNGANYIITIQASDAEGNLSEIAQVEYRNDLTA